LAGVASLALLGGGGIAAAQQSPQGHKDAAPGMSAHSTAQTPAAKPSGATAGTAQHAQTISPSGNKASPQAKADQPTMAQKSAESAKSESTKSETAKSETAKPEDMKPEAKTAQSEQKSGLNAKRSAQSSREHFGENTKSSSEAKQRLGENTKSGVKTGMKAREHVGAAEKTRHERVGANGRFERNHERMGANIRSERSHTRMSERSSHTRMSERSRRKGELKGLQANTSIPMQGSHVNLTSEQRTHIRDTVIDARGAPRVGHVDFDVSVGAMVPRHRIHAVRVPETLARIDPQWHGYLYFIVEDQVVIVNPHTMRIVAVLYV